MMDAAAELGRNLVSKHQIQPEYGMSRLTRDGTTEPVSRDQILRHERGQGNIHFPCSADHEQDCPVDPYSCYMCDRPFMSPVLSTCPPHTNNECGKERRILIGPWSLAKAALVRNYREVYWPCARGLSPVNAIGTQLRDLRNSGLTRWRMVI